MDTFADGSGGTLRARAFYELEVPAPFTGQTNAHARWLGTLTAFPRALLRTGRGAYLVLDFDVTGVLAGAATAHSAVRFSGPGVPPPQVFDFLTSGGVNQHVTFDPIPIVLGAPRGVTLEWIASIYAALTPLSC